MFRQPEQVYIYPEKSKTIVIGDEQVYVELVSIKNRKVELIIKTN